MDVLINVIGSVDYKYYMNNIRCIFILNTRNPNDILKSMKNGKIIMKECFYLILNYLMD